MARRLHHTHRATPSWDLVPAILAVWLGMIAGITGVNRFADYAAAQAERARAASPGTGSAPDAADPLQPTVFGG